MLHAHHTAENASTSTIARMTTSTQSGGLASSRRGPGIVWLVVSGLLGACTLLAPSDDHYLSNPDHSRLEAGAGGEGGDTTPNHDEAGTGGDGGDGPMTAAGDGGIADSSGGGVSSSAGSAGSHAGSAGSNGGTGGAEPLVCSPGLADCNQKAADGCEVDLTSSRDNCGGCGKAFACATDQVCENRTCISLSGCSDGTREGFLPIASWPHIAGCTAQWPRGSLRDAKTGSACGFESSVCNVPADACGIGWHVCAIPPFGPSEVSDQATQEECAAQPGAYAIAVGDQSCEPCTTAGAGAACCGDGCVQQNGSCLYPDMTAWFGMINNYVNKCGAIESALEGRGVLCCRSP